ncbi:hypothetical protein SAI_0957 [Streptococcus agalactiae H36B]|nr:hypothetical protein SAI_0957 [Streptococcus agalactiae H36B]
MPPGDILDVATLNGNLGLVSNGEEAFLYLLFFGTLF